MGCGRHTSWDSGRALARRLHHGKRVGHREHAARAEDRDALALLPHVKLFQGVLRVLSDVFRCSVVRILRGISSLVAIGRLQVDGGAADMRASKVRRVHRGRCEHGRGGWALGGLSRDGSFSTRSSAACASRRLACSVRGRTNMLRTSQSAGDHSHVRRGFGYRNCRSQTPTPADASTVTHMSEFCQPTVTMAHVLNRLVPFSVVQPPWRTIRG